MSDLDAADDLALEECIDELDAAIEKLERFPGTVLACALRAHLAGLLSALLEAGQIERGQIEEFLSGIGMEVFQPDPDVQRGPVFP